MKRVEVTAFFFASYVSYPLRLDFTRIAKMSTRSALDAWSSCSNDGQAI